MSEKSDVSFSLSQKIILNAFYNYNVIANAYFVLIALETASMVYHGTVK